MNASLQADAGGGWTSRISGLLRSFHSQPTPETTQLSTFRTKPLPKAVPKIPATVSAKDSSAPSDLLPEASSISSFVNNPPQVSHSTYSACAQDPGYSYSETTWIPQCTHAGSLTCSKVPHCALESDSHKFCSECIQTSIFQKSHPIHCNHVYCFRHIHRLSHSYACALPHSCSSACIEAHVCKHHPCHRCVGSEGAEIVHFRRRASHPGTAAEISHTSFSYQHKITLVDKGFPPYDKADEYDDGDKSASLEKEAILTEGAEYERAAEDLKESVSVQGAEQDGTQSVCSPPSSQGTEVAHSSIRNRISERNVKIYQSFSKKWQKFIYKWSSSEVPKDTSKAEVTEISESNSSSNNVETDAGRLVILEDNGSKVDGGEDIRSTRDDSVDALPDRDENIEVEDHHKSESSLASLDDLGLTNTNLLTGSSSNIREIKRYKASHSTSETLLCGKAHELDGDEVNQLAVKGGGKATSGQISVLSCPSLHPVGSSVDETYLESETDPVVSIYRGDVISSENINTVSEDNIVSDIGGKDIVHEGDSSTVKKKLRSVEDVKTNEKVSTAKERSYSLTSLLSNIKRKTSDDRSKSVSVEQKSPSTSTQSTIYVDDKFENVQQISDSDLSERDPSASEGQDELTERRSSVASTASEGRGSQRVNRIVSSTLGQWKRFQGSLGSLTTNIRQHYQQKIYKKRLSKEDAGKEISSSVCFEKRSEDLPEENLDLPVLSEQKRSGSLGTSLESQYFERQDDDNFWNKKLELHDLATKKEKEISHIYSSSFDKDSFLNESAMPEETQDNKDISSFIGDVVSPLSVSECTGEVSSASNSSGTTSSEGGDASIQSFLSVIVKVKPEKKVQDSVNGSQSEVMDDDKAEEKTIGEDEPYTEELSSVLTDDETKMDYEESDVGISSIEDKAQEFEDASEDEELTPSHTRRRPGEKISRETSESEDTDGEPLPKRPSLIVAVGASEGEIDSAVLKSDMSPSKKVQSSIVSTRRLFCEGMLGTDIVKTGVDSDYSSDSKLCDNSNIKIDDTAVTSALEKNNTHDVKPLDRHLTSEIYPHDDVKSDKKVLGLEVCDNIDSHDAKVAKGIESETLFSEKFDGAQESDSRLISGSPKKESVSKGEEGVVISKGEEGLVSHKVSCEDALQSNIQSEKASREVSESKSISSKFYDENVHEIQATGDQDHLPERVDHMKIDRGITKEVTLSEQDSGVEQEDVHGDREVPDIEEGAGQCITLAEKKNDVFSQEFPDTEDNVDFSRAQGEVQEEEMEMYDNTESNRLHNEGAYSLCKEEAVVSASTGGPKIVVTGAVNAADMSVISPPAIMLETGSVTSNDSLSEALAQTHENLYTQQSSSSNLAAHLGAHPHRPPTPKSPITVDEWVAALPHPTSVDDDGEAWSGCEQSSEDLAEDLLSLGDEAGLMSGSGARGSVSAASLVGGSSTCTRDSMIGSHMIGAQNSESSTNIAGTRDPTLTQLPLSSPQHHGMGQPLSPSHGNRPMTLSDLENTMQKQMQPVSPLGVEGRRSQFASLRDKQTSFQSDLSGLSLQSRSSIDSLLDSRQADPVDVLLSLGFGAQSQEGLARIPERFLKPSQVRGNNIDEFIRSEDEFSDMMESAEWMPGLDPQALRRSSVATVSPLMSQILDNIRENRSRYLQSKDSPLRAAPQATLTGASRFASIAKNIGTKSAIMKSFTGSTNKLSVLNPENRRLLDLQGQKSPEVPRKRLIIGQSSFDLGRDGELLVNNEGNNEDGNSNEEDSIAEEDSLDDDSSDDDDDDEPGVRRFTQRPPLQHKESVWSMASSATSIDSNEEDLRDQRRKLQLSLNRRPTPPESPSTPPTPGDSADSPNLLYSGADGVNRRRNIFKRLSQSKRVSTVSSGGSWDLDEKIPEEEMEEESFHDVQEQIIQESDHSHVFPHSDQLLARSPETCEYHSYKDYPFLPESVVLHQVASQAAFDRVSLPHSLPKSTNQTLDTNVHQFDACESCGAMPHSSAGNVEVSPLNQENGALLESKRNTSPLRNASSLRRQERIDDGAPCGNPLLPSLLQIPSHQSLHNSVTDQDDTSRSGNTGPLHRSGSAQSDSSGFMEGDLVDGENRNVSSSQLPNVNIPSPAHTWWWSHESAGSMETVRHVPVSNTFPLRPSHGPLGPQPRSVDQQPVLQQRNSACGYSLHTCKQHGNHSWKHKECHLPSSGSSSNSCHTSNAEHSLSLDSHVPLCPVHSADGHQAASENYLSNIPVTAPSIETLMNALRSYRNQLVQQEHLSRTLHATAAFSLSNANHFSKQLHSISAIKAAIRAEVTHMEQLLANAKPNSFNRTCINSVMMQMVSLLRKQAELCHDIERLTLSPSLSSPKSDDSVASKTLSCSSLRNECDVTNSAVSHEDNNECSFRDNDIAKAVPQFSQPENVHCSSKTESLSSFSSPKPVVENIGPRNSNPISLNSQTAGSIGSEKDCDSILKSSSKMESLHVTDTSENMNVHKLSKSFLLSSSEELTPFVKTCDSVKGSESTALDDDEMDSSDKMARMNSTYVEINLKSPANPNVKPNALHAEVPEDLDWVTQLVETQVRNHTQIVQTHLNQQSREMEDIKNMLHLLLNKFQ